MQMKNTLLVTALTLALSACASSESETKSAITETAKQSKIEMTNKAMEAVDLNNGDLYEAHVEGRIYVFDDFDTYQEFLSVGETSFRQTFIGAGPNGETIVYGMTSEDKKKHFSKIAAYNLYMGTLAPSESFYGEMRMENRIYVFDSVEDMKSVREVGEASLRYTDIGSGPKGETVVYVLRNDNKKVKPVAMIEEFKKHNNIK
ncbi:hypothetical protein N8878_07320 [Psychromonas sp.]|nr:hypothetical protein [Psychromonas sp.]